MIKFQLKDTSTTITNFTGYQLFVFFQKIDSSAPSNLISASLVLNVTSSGVVDFDVNSIEEGKVQISLKGPAGNILSTKYSDKASLISQPVIELDYSFSQLILSQNIVLPPGVVNGKLIDSTGTKKLEEIQIIIYAAVSNARDQYFPVHVINTESEGYFFFPYPTDNYSSAYALIGTQSATGKNKIVITFDKDANGINTFPKRLLLVLEPDNSTVITTDANTDCGCNEFDFQEQKRVLDEFSYYSLIRTSDPEIKAYSVNEEEDISLDDLLRTSPTSSNPIILEIAAYPINIFGHPKLSGIVTPVNPPAPLATASIQPRTIKSAATQPVTIPPPVTPVLNDNSITDQLKNIKIKKSVVKDFLDQYKVLNKDTYTTLLQMNDAAKITNLIKTDSPHPLGRTILSSNNQVDWDNNPTIYQATSIAYGHLLHYKQQWVADGYSLGDLVYSLPLAPGQKKQIVVFDWERRESASNSQEIDYEESLDNSLSRDRDISEIASGVVNEKLNGSSTSTVKSASAGLGATIGPLVLGASGGISKSNSSASQDSMRAMAASDSQHLSDKTIQSANSVRSQRSTVVQTVAQGEKYEVSAESVANYNHCHALTIQYFEVLRHFKVQQKLVDAQECLFVPLPIVTFDIDKARRWREILTATVRDKSLRKAFDSLQRVKDRWEHSDFPATTFAAENVLNLSGNIKLRIDLVCPSDVLTTKTRQITYPSPSSFGATYTDNEDYTVADYDPTQWQWMQELLHLPPLDFYNTYIRDQKNRDDIFLRQLGDKIAQQIVENLTFKVIDDNGNSLPVTIDASLSSTFHNGVPLSVSLRLGLTAIPREKFIYLQIGLNPNTQLPAFTKMLVTSGLANYRTQHRSARLFSYSSIKDDLGLNDSVMIYCGPTHAELRNPKEDDVEAVNKLIYHLNANLEFYHKMIWLYITPERRFMLLDGINLYVEDEQRMRSVASVVNNKLIGIVGNSMVFQVIPGLNLNPDFRQGIANERTGQMVPLIDYYQHEPLDPLRISVPTKGVFAEAMMGKCNSCEKKDESRFWRWEESPIPDSPTSISPIVTPTPTVTQPNLQANPLASPVVNIQNAPAAPDPQGLAAAISLLGKSDTFKDVTGLAANQSNALAGLQSSLSTTSSFGQMGLDLRKAIMQNSLDQQKAQSESNIRQSKLAAVKDLYEKGKIDKADFDKYLELEGMDPELKKTIDANTAAANNQISEPQKEAITNPAIIENKDLQDTLDTTLKCRENNQIAPEQEQDINEDKIRQVHKLPRKRKPVAPAVKTRTINFYLSVDDSGFSLDSTTLILYIEKTGSEIPPLDATVQSGTTLYNFGSIQLLDDNEKGTARLTIGDAQDEYFSQPVYFSVPKDRSSVYFNAKLVTNEDTWIETSSSSESDQKLATKHITKSTGKTWSDIPKLKVDVKIVSAESGGVNESSGSNTTTDSGSTNTSTTGNSSSRQFHVIYLTGRISLSLES